MKTLLTALVLKTSFMCSAATLGSPDEDPVVKNLRERFASGRAPENEELLNKSFTCKWMAARKGNFKKKDIPSKLTFSKFDGFLISHQKATKMDGKYLVNNGSELIGNTETPQYMSYRIDTNGFLIGEWTGSIDTRYKLEPIVTGIPSKQMAVAYIICVEG